MSDLAGLKCVPCRGGEPALTRDEIEKLLAQTPDWQVLEENGILKLERTYKLKNFRQALDFTNQIGAAAEAEDHHPLIQTEWGKVKVVWWTHKLGGLHRNDFIMAARTDALYQAQING